MNKYHGWIVVQREPGYADRFFVEHNDDEAHERRTRKQVGSAAEAVEYFDKKAGQPVKLHDSPLGAFRVYTEHENGLIISRTKSQDVRANALRMECQRLVATVRQHLEKRTALNEHDQTTLALANVAEQMAELTK